MPDVEAGGSSLPAAVHQLEIKGIFLNSSYHTGCSWLFADTVCAPPGVDLSDALMEAVDLSIAADLKVLVQVGSFRDTSASYQLVRSPGVTTAYLESMNPSAVVPQHALACVTP